MHAHALTQLQLDWSAWRDTWLGGAHGARVTAAAPRVPDVTRTCLAAWRRRLHCLRPRWLDSCRAVRVTQRSPYHYRKRFHCFFLFFYKSSRVDFFKYSSWKILFLIAMFQRFRLNSFFRRNDKKLYVMINYNFMFKWIVFSITEFNSWC